MKLKTLFGTFMFLLCLFCFISCSNDDEITETVHLSFEKSYYERPLIGAKSIMVRGGNRDYSIEIEDPTIVDIKVDLSSPVDMGSLKVYPKQKGETTIEVKDNIADETVSLKIKITDSYLNLAVDYTTPPPYKQGNEFFLINNDSKDFYLYDENLKLEHTGTYQFYLENDTPYMELTYHKEFEGRTIYKYDLRGTSQAMFAMLNHFLGWNVDDFIEESEAISVAPVVMSATDVETNTAYRLIMKMNDIPEKILE